MALSQPGLLFISSPAGTDDVKDLGGRTFFSLASGEAEVLALCHDGVHGVGLDGTVALSDLPMVTASSGRGFYVGIDANQSIYTWGSLGQSGQLGQGACHQFLQEPTKLAHSSPFVSVSCGQAFALALDDKGGAHSWGENFERQLGLYTKTKAEMHLQNAMVEDLSFVPRLIPLSISHPVTKVACGQKFATIITKGGILYSWGAGESGQLGTGRCTQREVPAPVMLRDAEGGAAALVVRDVACGAGHVLAVTETGELYGWGLNKSHQLGNDSTRTEQYPVLASLVQLTVPDPSLPLEDSNLREGAVLSRVFAHGHSSAAIDNQGRLYTWGSALNDRLMHVLPLQKVTEPVQKVLSYAELRTQRMACAPGSIGHHKATRVQAKKESADALASRRLPISTIARPTLVRTQHLADCAVHDFAFAATHSAAFVLTCLKKAWPSEGPRRSFSKLRLLGDGFWNAPNIIVKFTFKQAHLSATNEAVTKTPAPAATARSSLPGDPGFNPPRSCSGQCLDSSTIECKPPKFSEPGVYSVSISMDGTTFLRDTVEIFVHQELVVQKQAPELLDLSASATVEHLELHVLGLPTMPAYWQGEYTVRLVFTCLEKDNTGGNNSHNNTARTASTKNSDYSRKIARVEEPTPDFFVTTVATLVPPTTRASTPLTAHSADSDNEDEEEGQKAPPVEEAPVAAVLLCTDLDLSDFQATAGRALFEMRCQVSLNGQDFSSLKVATAHRSHHHQRSQVNHSVDGIQTAEGGDHHHVQHQQDIARPPSTLVYAFTPDFLQPSCLSLDRFLSDPADQTTSQLVNIAVKGRSFLPASRLPKGARVVATLAPLLADITWRAGFASQLNEDSARDLYELSSAHYDVRCDSSSSLTIAIDSEASAQLQRLVTGINALANGQSIPTFDDAATAEEGLEEGASTAAPLPPQSIDLLPLQLDFAMILANGQLLNLTSYSAECPPLRLNLYRDQPLQIVPSCTRASTVGTLPFSLLVSRAAGEADLAAGLPAGASIVCDGLPFHSDDVVVAVYVPVPGGGGGAAESTGGNASNGPSRADFYPPLLLPKTDVRLCPVPNAAAPESEEPTAEETPLLAAPEKFLLQFALPSLSDLVATVSSGGAGGLPSFVYVTCWLDGRSVPATSTWSKLLYLGGNLIGDSAVNPAAPKAGFLAGNTVTLDLHEYCPISLPVHPSLLQLPAESERQELAAPVEVDADGVVTARTDVSALEGEAMALAPQPQQYVVRIRGAPTTDHPQCAGVCVAGRLSNPAGSAFATSIAFEIPEGIKTQPGMAAVQKTPKDKAMYFVDVSIDGGLSFDSAELPLLFLK